MMDPAARAGRIARRTRRARGSTAESHGSQSMSSRPIPRTTSTLLARTGPPARRTLAVVAALAATLTATRAQSSPAKPAPGPRVRVSAEHVDFGRVAPGATVTSEIILESVGDAPLAVTRVGTTCDCAKLRLSTATQLNVPIDKGDQGNVQLTLAPGEKATLKLLVDTTRLAAGKFEKGLKIFCSD